MSAKDKSAIISGVVGGLLGGIIGLIGFLALIFVMLKIG